ncbi:MAG: M48 family metalloprotease [Vicinamibacterales bacterium]
MERPSVLLVPVSFVVLALACATNPVTGKRELSLMSEGQEIAIGKENHPQILAEMGQYNDPALQQYVRDLGQRLAKTSERPSLPWTFTVVDQPVVNAFAVPGGFIYITRGILAYLDSEAQLAGVLGHEIGHVTARHSAQQYSRAVAGQLGLLGLGIFVPAARPFGEVGSQALGLLFLKYGREDELQSDALGAQYAAANAWDPRAVPGFLSVLARLREGSEKGIPNWLSTHPDPASRVEEIQPLVQKLTTGRTDFRVNRDDYLRRIDGMIFGDSPEQGIVRGSAFLHAPLRFRVDYPQGWAIQNTARQVVAKAPNADVFLVLQIVQQPSGSSVQDVALASMEGAGFRAVDGQRTTINGLDAFIGVYQGQVEGLGAVASRAAHIAHGGSVYLLAGLVPPQAFDQADPTFVQTIRSFRPLSAAEAENIRPNRVDLHVVRQGDTWQSLAERSGGVADARTLAALNSSQAGAQPQPGSRIKIVVGG